MSQPDAIAFVVLSMVHGTNEHPPRGLIRIDEVLRGTLACGERDVGFPTQTGNAYYAKARGGETGLSRWKGERRMGPSVGAKLCGVVHANEDGSLDVDALSCWPDDADARARLRRG